ncbi:hypothetical protein [Adhaeretor mobilis]|uniref:Uncharacterized protein n=1 Tax=Adhaeretor mobilis TaxID=1930276 RepID=A0A517MT45_9BACT|nr:hypothetical protein [Adhaeretor mobilis]QDS98061.1 hypothetical protein HG15A2_13320 [Adhaeretor mobilis]
MPHHTRFFQRPDGLILSVCCLTLLATFLPQVQGRTGLSPKASGSVVHSEDSGFASKSGKRRLREGTRIEGWLGHFELKSQSATFRTEQGHVLGSLANLNLERIVATLQAADKPEDMWWSVSGTITEYSGKNHVLISRAVYKATAVRPEH